MKKILLIGCLLGMLGCSNNDDVGIDPTGEKWVLNNVSCFCFFEDDFDFSTHTIRFNPDNNTVIVENAESTAFLAPAGTYSYSVDGSIITIDDRKYRYEETGDSLVLTYVDEPTIADDEVSYFYVRD